MNMEMDSISEKVGEAKPVDGGVSSTGPEASPEAPDKLAGDSRPTAAPSDAPVEKKRRKLFIPTGGPDHPWWIRHAVILSIFEWLIAILLLATAAYYFWFLIFPADAAPEPAEPPPTREEFRIRARELPPIEPDNAWAVNELSPRWRRIIIHHSATDSGNEKIFDRVHREERKWENGLGYHFVIGNGRGMEDGEVAVGNRWRDQLDGAHIKGSDRNENLNAQSIGIALVGNFQNSLPTARQLASLKGLVNHLRRRCRISLADVCGHRDFSGRTTLCPGEHFHIDELRLALANP